MHVIDVALIASVDQLSIVASARVVKTYQYLFRRYVYMNVNAAVL